MIRHGVCNFPVPDLGCWFSPSLGKHCTNAQCDPNSSGKILRTSQERQHLVPHFWIKLRSIVNIKVSTPTSHFNTSLNKGQKKSQWRMIWTSINEQQCHTFRVLKHRIWPWTSPARRKNETGCTAEIWQRIKDCNTTAVHCVPCPSTQLPKVTTAYLKDKLETQGSKSPINSVVSTLCCSTESLQFHLTCKQVFIVGEWKYLILLCSNDPGNKQALCN